MFKINNLPKTHKKFVVAMNVDGELWFWGSWDDPDRAREVAAELPMDCVVTAEV